MDARVSDLTVEQLRQVIEETVRRTLLQTLADPDLGLEVRQDFGARLKSEIEAAGRGETLPIGVVLADLGVEW